MIFDFGKKEEQLEIPQVKTVGKRPFKKYHKGGRRSIVYLFLITVFGIGAVLVWSEFPRLWQKLNQPLVVGELAEEEAFNPSPAIEQFDNLTSEPLGTYGFYVYRLGDGKEYGKRQEEVFPAASLMKLPLMVVLYQEAQLRQTLAGQVDNFLETKYKLRSSDKVAGAGILAGKPAGTVYTYRQLAEFMGKYSDNTAYMVIRRILGDKKTQEVIENLGMFHTSLKKNATTPEDMGLLLSKLYLGNVVSEKHKEEILDYLTKTAFEDWLPAGLPEGVKIAHKIGKDTATFSDAGIVFGDNPYVIVVMSKNAREPQALEALPKISKAIWEFETAVNP